MRIATLLLAAALTLPTADARAQADAAAPESLGDVRFETSCPAPTRDRFDRAVALLHHMTYSRARAEFSELADSFPTCPMAHWGVAMTLFTPLWPTRPSDADLRRGWAEVLRAREIGAETPRERMFIDAAAAFFDPSAADYWERIRRWEAASRAVHEAFPDDDEATAFFALAHLAVAPPSGEGPNNAEAAALLGEILRRRPMHPGAIHYTIHANDAAGREHESLDVVRRYADIAPRNPHALHMPSHIYARLGEWQDVIDANRAAAEAALENPAGDRGQWVWDEFPHAIEYLVYALLQRGDDDGAAAELTRLASTPRLEPTFKTAFHLASVPARFALERRDWAAAARLDPRPDPSLDWDRFPWPEAVTWFARGVGAARGGDTAAAATAESRIARLRDASRSAGEELFARQTEILRLGVAAWLARAEGDPERAVSAMRQAAEMEAATPKPPVTPAPTLPAAEMLGDLLLELDRPAEALAAYQASLADVPRRFNGLAGAALAARRAGRSDLAADYDRQLRAVAAPDSRRPGPGTPPPDRFPPAPGARPRSPSGTAPGSGPGR